MFDEKYLGETDYQTLPFTQIIMFMSCAKRSENLNLYLSFSLFVSLSFCHSLSLYNLHLLSVILSPSTCFISLCFSNLYFIFLTNLDFIKSMKYYIFKHSMILQQKRNLLKTRQIIIYGFILKFQFQFKYKTNLENESNYRHKKGCKSIKWHVHTYII